MTDLDQLERLAREATPGPWVLSHAGTGTRSGFTVTEYYVMLPGSDFALAADVVDADMKPSEANAAYIAACSPDQVLRLVSIARAAKLANDYHQGLAAINRCELSKFDAALREALSPEKETSAARTPEAR